jgi:U3 small nucleolar RNA-associated protein 4
MNQTLVWALHILPDGTLVSGDSRGHVSFWDTTTGTMVQSFQEHTADVFALVASSDGLKVFASGADSRVAMFQATGATEGRQWAYSYSYRPHTHDVRALVRVTCKGNSDDSNIEALVSGGDDTQVSIKRRGLLYVFRFAIESARCQSKHRNGACWICVLMLSVCSFNGQV